MQVKHTPQIESSTPRNGMRRSVGLFLSAAIIGKAKLPLSREVQKTNESRGAFKIRSLLLLSSCCLLSTLPGCGYTLAQSFNRDIKTVAVPIFENTTNRRGLEFQLTEAVQSEITKRTPYRLAKGLEADTRLTGKIVGFRKDVLGETRYDDPRELQISMMVEVRWEDLRTGQLLAQQEIPLSPDAIPLSTQSEMAPEIGQSLATAMDDSLHSMARRIVNLMEAW